jgi:regulator of sirC expression with transglutaminase-like and TPR domain
MKPYSKKVSIEELFSAEINKPDSDIDLGRAALLIAKGEYPSLDIETYLERFDQMASAIKELPGIKSTDDIEETINAISSYLFDELNFRGNKDNYYDPKNSFLNEVLDRKTGIPITLSVIYIEVARRLGIKVDGVGMPGHFLLKCSIGEHDLLFDAFNAGKILTETECEQLLNNIYGEKAKFHPSYLKPVKKREILRRMLGNLKNIYISGGDSARALSIVERLLAIEPDSISEIRDRGLLNFNLNRLSASLKDLETYLAKCSEGPEAEAVRLYIARIKSKLASLN